MILILEMCSYSSTDDDTVYQRCVKCINCLAEYMATIKKGVLVSQHPCYNCGKTKLIPN